MSDAREQRMRQLEDAIEAFVKHDDSADQTKILDRQLLDRRLLDRSEELRELLEPMLAPPPEDQTAAPRRVLGDVELRAEIGRGGMGVVYEGFDRALRRPVAVKLLARGPDTSAAAVVRFRREAELAASLDHPNIVRVHSVGETDDLLYLVMALEPAPSLAQCLTRLAGRDPAVLPGDALRSAARTAAVERFGEPQRGADTGSGSSTAAPGPARDHIHEALRITAAVADALTQAHAAGVVHRDVKPGNILLGADGRPKLTDFGLARQIDAPAVTRSGDAPGTPQYMAPEQARGERGVGPAADVFALGAVLYELLTLRRAFDGEHTAEVLQRVLHDDPTDPRRVNPAVSRDIVAVLWHALHKDPTQRYPTAAEFAADLHALLRGDAVSVRPPSSLGRLARRIRRNPWKAIAAALLLAAIPTLVTLLGLEQRERRLRVDHEARVLEEQIDTLLDEGFREIGEGEPGAARAAFEAIVQLAPRRAEGVAGLALVEERSDRAAALLVLDQHRAVVDASPALRRLRDALTGPTPAEAVADLEGCVGFDAFVQGFRAVLRGHDLQEADAEAAATAFTQAARLLHRAAVSAEHPRPVFHAQWLHAAAHAGDLGSVDAAITALRQLWPDRATSWFWIAFARFEAGDDAAGARAIARARQLAPDSIAIVMNQILLLRRAGELQQALQIATEAVIEHPGETLLWRQLARTHAASGDHQAAITAYRKAMPLPGPHKSDAEELCEALLRTRQPQQAAKLADQLLRLGPDDPNALLLCSEVARHLGDPAKTRRLLARYLELRPGTATMWLNLGNACIRTGDTDAAKLAFERCVALDPDHAHALVNLANIHLRGGDPAQAEPLLRRAVGADPRLANARRSLLVALRADPERSVAMLREWCTAVPDDAEPWRLLAVELARLPATTAPPEPGPELLAAESLAAARKAHELGGDSGPVLHALGVALLATGDIDGAREVLSEARSALPDGDRFTPYYLQQIQAALDACNEAERQRGR